MEPANRNIVSEQEWHIEINGIASHLESLATGPAESTPSVGPSALQTG